MKKKSATSKVVAGLVIACAVIGGIFTISHIKIIGTGKVGITYTYSSGVKDELLKPGAHFIPPMEYMKEFSTSNEILVLSKDSRDGSKDDDSFKVATSDDANIAISFQMTYRYIEDQVIDTYKKFKGMDGEDIVENRVKTVLKSKISEVTTDYSMMDIYSGNRTQLNEALTEYLNKDFSKKYGIEVLDASIIDVHPDKKLKKAIDNRVTALQEKQQAQAEQEKVKVQKQTEQLQAEADANIEITKAQADAEKTKIKTNADAENTRTKAKAQAEANKELSASITEDLIKMKEAEARLKHGWVTVKGANSTVVDATEK
jgi:regulator of protease activity HflC (stomatin/prohibitin superfamily)|nr:MAG TPA: High frequency of lysogenization C protein [Caudoviricetes sp.]